MVVKVERGGLRKLKALGDEILELKERLVVVITEAGDIQEGAVSRARGLESRAGGVLKEYVHSVGDVGRALGVGKVGNVHFSGSSHKTVGE